MRVSRSRRHALIVISGLALAVASGCGPRVDPEQTGDGSLRSPYLAIGEVLAADSVDHLDRLAAQVVSAAETRAGEPGVDEMLAAAGRLPSPDIANARVAFRKLSRGYIRYLLAHPEAREGLEVVHCPMAFGGEGANWVQAEAKVSNPYEGAMMLRCGHRVPWGDLGPDGEPTDAKYRETPSGHPGR